MDFSIERSIRTIQAGERTITEETEICKLMNKTHIANLVAAFAIIAGIVFVFITALVDEIVTSPPELLLLIVGAGIGYLFAKKAS